MHRFYMCSKDGNFKATQNENMAFECDLDAQNRGCLLRHSLKHHSISYVNSSRKNALCIRIFLNPAKIHIDAGIKNARELTVEDKVEMAHNLRDVRMRIHEHCLGNYMAPVLEAIAILEYQFGLYNY